LSLNKNEYRLFLEKKNFFYLGVNLSWQHKGSDRRRNSNSTFSNVPNNRDWSFIDGGLSRLNLKIKKKTITKFYLAPIRVISNDDESDLSVSKRGIKFEYQNVKLRDIFLNRK